MASIMEMPKLSDTMKEGSIAKWLKKEGDKVSSGQPIIEIETDKATMEYEATASGILLKILVGDGGKCPLQSPIAVIGKADENWQEALEKYQIKKTPAPKNTEAPSKTQTAPSAPATTKENNSSGATSDVIKASPLAKKIAAEKGINLESIQGSGPNGRIVQRDIESVQTNSGVMESKTFTNAVEKIPLTNMRKTIASRLKDSLNTAPHFFLSISINMDNLLQWRQQVIAKLPPEKKFSVNDIIIFLTSRALKAHPEVNSSWKDEFIEQYKYVHMSMAVALPNGLITPVIRNADSLNIFEIATESKRLVKIAKEGKLQPNDYSGGTFSISNLGMSGIEDFTAIINPPQAAILAVGSTLPTPVVKNNGEIGVEQRMKVTLSCDHRVIDGAVGSEFLKTLKTMFEDPMSALFFF